MKRTSPWRFVMLGMLAICFGLTIWATSLFASPHNQASAEGVWRDVQERQINLQGQRMITPDVYRVVAADTTALHNILAAAPLEGTTKNSDIILSLPLPDGSWSRFAIINSPIMETDLAKKYPDMQTYRGYSLDQRGVTARLDWTPAGFHGLIYLANDMIFIDPYSRNDTTHYISYSRNAYMTPARRAENGMEQLAPVTAGRLPAPNLNEPARLGETLRTYRLAVAATGEYTTFHGGTVADGQAAIVTSVNRVVGVYEKDFAVRMVLVNDNDQLVYTNGGTDPYTNNDGFAMLDQNQTNVDAVIGDANYDVGHVYSTGGGGIAQLGVPCQSGSKARGVTGRGAPVGDPFDIDYVAHEIGHQFGANHTFNGNAGACSGGNRNGSTAYEPGSGSTIMAYAGICSPQDLQPNSDPYFHYVSIAEVGAYITSATGDACAVKTATGNTPPSAEAGASYTIPANTPFQLTGSATDVDGDALTYTWEEYDLGPANNPISDNGSSPIFRSFNPSSSPVRILPRLSDLLNNTSTIGEVLPTTNRTMAFRLTVRDNNPNGGGTGSDTMNVTVTNAQGPFAVTAPNTAVTWAGESQETVTWNVAGTTAAPVSCPNVSIQLSIDGGFTYATLLASTANDGSEQITVPNAPTTVARIKVACANNIFFDISNANFTITQGAGPTSTPVPVTPTSTPVPTSTPTITPTPSTTPTPSVTPTPINTCIPGHSQQLIFFDDVETLNNYWTPESTLGTNAWVVSNAAAHSPDESWFGPSVSTVSDQRLVMTNAIAIPGTASSGYMSFWHSYDLERGSSIGYDGGIVEYSIDNGATWQDAGSLIVVNGYNLTISANFDSPIAGRQAFSGNSGGFIQSELDLTSLVGQSVQFRFLLATDRSTSRVGWYIDDMQISFCGVSGGTPTSTPAATNTPTVTTPTPTVTGTPPTVTPTVTGTPPTPTSTIGTTTPTATQVVGDEFDLYLPIVTK